MDRYLDTTRTGPQWLMRDDVASIVTAQILRADGYALHSWVVMSNHVHILIEPLIDASEMMRRLKGRTARDANLALCRTGQQFWEAESYDHWVRNAEEHGKIVRYIESNPVRAGLVASPEDYKWSSAWKGWERTGISGAEAPVAG
jgi:putative transposase